MRTAVLISGQMRTGDLCLPSIKRHLLDRLGNFDVYAHIAEDADAEKVKLFHPLVAFSGPQPDLDEANYIHRTGRGVYGIQVVLRQLWSLQESMAMAMGYAEKAGIEYTHAVRLRSDSWFLNDVEDPMTWAPGVYIPTFYNFWGLCDRFAFGDWASMVAYHDRFANLEGQIERGCIFHPETMLDEHLKFFGVPVHRTRVLFDTVRADGARVPPRWNAGAQYGDVEIKALA